jgi:hypothetical protein
MALKFTVGALSDVQEEYRQFYNDNGSGEFTLQVDGAVSKQELKSLREANITLKREADDIRAKYEGIDPAEFHKLMRQEHAERDWQMFQDGRGDEVIANRTAAMRAEHQRVLGIVTAECDAAKAELDAALIGDALRDAAFRLGVLPEAAEDLLLRGAAVLRVVDGRAVAHAGNAPITASEWVASLSRTSPHLFEGSSSGASPGGSQAGRGLGATISRAQFDGLESGDRWEAMRAGTQIVA